MRRCEHGVYVPEGETTAIYCSGCNPSQVILGAREVNLPHHARAMDSERMTANRHMPGRCPACNSAVWIAVSDKSLVQRECADCGARYKVRASAAPAAAATKEVEV